MSSRSWSSRVRRNDLVALAGKGPAFLNEDTAGHDPCDRRVDRRQVRGGVHRRRDEELLQHGGTGEENLALVGVVPEERALRQPGPLGDLRHRGLVEPPLDVELHGRLLEPAPCVWFPPAHAHNGT